MVKLPFGPTCTGLLRHLNFGQSLWDKLWWCRGIWHRQAKRRRMRLCHDLLVWYGEISLTYWTRTRLCHNLLILIWRNISWAYWTRMRLCHDLLVLIWWNISLAHWARMRLCHDPLVWSRWLQTLQFNPHLN
jgi:hypothetical protein